jgi:uncharacterized protein (DUF1330 family)
MLRMLVLMALAVVVAACHSPSGGQTAPADLTVTYRKTGGFLPFDDTFVVRGDGALTHTGRDRTTREARVAPADLARLRSLLSSPEYRAAAGEYRNDRGADLVTHRIESRLGGETKTAVVMTATEHPKVLDQVIDELERLAAMTK